MSQLGGWVDGPDLANEQVGGSEGLRRLRELIEEGYPIDARPHPDKNRSVWQYRFRTNAVSPIREERPKPEVYISPAPVARGTENLYKFDALPAKIDFGSVAVCPRCHGRTPKVHLKNYDGARHKDPTKAASPCINCNGWGIVPNIGPIAIHMPEAMDQNGG